MKKPNPLIETIKFALILAIPLVCFAMLWQCKNPHQAPPETVISNNRAQMERELRRLLREDSLCAQFLQGTLNALESDTTTAGRLRYFHEHVTPQATASFRSKWDSMYRGDTSQSQILYGILGENAGPDCTAEETELFFSALKTADGLPVVP